MKFPKKSSRFSISSEKDKKNAGNKEPTPGIKKDDKKQRCLRSQGSYRGSSYDPSEPEESPRPSRRRGHHRSTFPVGTSKSSLFPEVICRITVAQVDEIGEEVDYSMDIKVLFDEDQNYGRSTFQERIHRILKVGRINNVKRYPIMKGKILGCSNNKCLSFLADTDTRVAIIPMSLAERNKLKVVPTDKDEPEYEGLTGMKLSMVRQTEMFVCFRTMKSTKVLRPIVSAVDIVLPPVKSTNNKNNKLGCASVKLLVYLELQGFIRFQ